MFDFSADKTVVTVLAAMIFVCLFSVHVFAAQLTVGFVAGGEALDDDTFNGMTISGLRQLQKEYDLKVEVSSGGFGFEDIRKGLESVIKRNSDVIIINSSTNIDEIIAFTQHYPDLFLLSMMLA